MSVLEFCRWVQYSSPLVAMRRFALALSRHRDHSSHGPGHDHGAVLLVDLRLLGLGLQRQPVAELARDAERWLVRGLFVTVSTGILLFMCFATKYYYLTFFWVKMAALLVVLALTFSVRRKVALADDTSANRPSSKVIAVVSLALWTIVAVGGRYIGFP